MLPQREGKTLTSRRNHARLGKPQFWDLFLFSLVEVIPTAVHRVTGRGGNPLSALSPRPPSACNRNPCRTPATVRTIEQPRQQGTLPGGKNKASPFSKLMFSWIGPLVQLAYARPLEPEHLFPLPESCETSVLLERFKVAWDDQLAKPKGQRR